jgi:hypothetical protein
MRGFKLKYPFTQPFTIPHITIIVCALGVLWTIVVTLVNVAALGYDVVPVYSTSFSSSGTLLWYEKFVLTRWFFPASWSCDPMVLEPWQRTISLEFRF